MSEARILNTKTTHADPAKLVLHGANPRKGELPAIVESFRANGFWGSVIVDERNEQVLAGNHRVMAARELGWQEIPVTYIRPDSDEHALRILLADNRTSDLGTYDNDSLAQLLDHLASTDAGLVGTGYDTASLDDLLKELGQNGETKEAPDAEIDRAEELRDKWQTERGQLWQIGRHRLLCGDCRDAADVSRLLDGKKINVCVTSPPYASQRKYDEASEFKPIPPDEYADWYEAVQANVATHLASDGSFLLNIKEHCNDGQRHLYVKELTIRHVREWGWRFVDEFCWRDTKNGVPGGWGNRFKDAWEPVFHYCKHSSIKFNPLANGSQSGAVFEYSPATAKTSTGSGLLGEKATDERDGIARPSNVLEIAASSTGGHSAAFPADLPAWFIRAFSDHGDVIFEPFCGSGTTLCAAEQEGRDGYGIEISPKYVAVTLERLSKMGLVPELASERPE